MRWVRETGAHRRVRLRGRDNARKRFIALAAALNLGLVMRTLFKYGTPREMAAESAAVWNILLRFIHAAVVDVHRRFLGTAFLPTVDAPIAAWLPLAVAARR